LKYLHVIIGIQTESALSSPSLDGRGLGEGENEAGKISLLPPLPYPLPQGERERTKVSGWKLIKDPIW
jgi:hypothetical protein